MANPADNGHPGNDYYVSVTGTIQRQSNPALAFALQSSGWSGPYDWAGAKSVAGNVTKRISQGYIGSTGFGEVGNAAGQTGTAASQAAGNALGNITGGITGFHGSNFVMRGAKILIGATLLIVGIVHMTGMGGAAVDVVKKIPLPV